MGIVPARVDGIAIRAKFMEYGIPQLDAELIVDCINVRKSQLWQNDGEVTEAAVSAMNKYILDNNYGVVVKAEPARFGKIIWEVKLLAKPAAAPGV